MVTNRIILNDHKDKNLNIRTFPTSILWIIVSNYFNFKEINLKNPNNQFGKLGMHGKKVNVLQVHFES